MNILILTVAMALWGLVHSFLASHFAKDMIDLRLGGVDFYRLAYNGFSVISLAPVYYLMKTLPDVPLYQAPAPYNILMFGGQLLALLFLFISFLQTDSLSFIGLRQLFEGEKAGALVTRGFYRVVRHPLYTFGLMFLWLTPTVTRNTFTVYLGGTLYIIIGAYFEERKLLREFGEAYAQYKKKTAMLIPGLVFGEWK